MYPGNIIMGGGPYKQSAKNDLWLPVMGAGVAFLVRCLPIIAVILEAVIIGRAFGVIVLALAMAYAALASWRGMSLVEIVKATFWLWLIGGAFSLLWAFDQWPVPEAWLVFRFGKALASTPLQHVGRWYVMWSVGGAALESMGPWLALRAALAVALPFAFPDPWRALNWRTLTEIMAPSYANSIVAPRGAVAHTEQDATPQREDSAPRPAANNGGLF